MRAHDLRRHELQETALDANPTERINVVAGPETVRVADDARIDPTCGKAARSRAIST
jgi:hypothetical protein